jgi:hypothetical protein
MKSCGHGLILSTLPEFSGGTGRHKESRWSVVGFNQGLPERETAMLPSRRWCCTVMNVACLREVMGEWIFLSGFFDLLDLCVWRCEHKCRVLSSLPRRLITSWLYSHINKRIFEQVGNKTDATRRRWPCDGVYQQSSDLLPRTLYHNGSQIKSLFVFNQFHLLTRRH